MAKLGLGLGVQQRRPLVALDHLGDLGCVRALTPLPRWLHFDLHHPPLGLVMVPSRPSVQPVSLRLTCESDPAKAVKHDSCPCRNGWTKGSLPHQLGDPGCSSLSYISPGRANGAICVTESCSVCRNLPTLPVQVVVLGPFLPSSPILDQTRPLRTL